MIKIATIIIILNTFFIFPQVWKSSLKETNSFIRDIHFEDDNNGFVVGIDGKFYKTSDGGTTLVENKISHLNLNSLYAFSLYEIIIVADSGYILNTIDGGINWNVNKVGEFKFEKIKFINNTGYALSKSLDTIVLYKSMDRGLTWNTNFKQVGKSFYDFDFFDESHGVLVGGGVGSILLYYTKDGNTWSQSQNPTFSFSNYTRFDLKSVCMHSIDNVIAVGWGSPIQTQQSIILKSTDGGETWEQQVQAAENKTYENLFNVQFFDSVIGIAVGGNTRGMILLRTTDGGINWNKIPSTIGVAGLRLYRKNTTMWVIGDNGYFAVSDDYGLTWKQKNVHNLLAVYKMQWLDVNTCFGIGQSSYFIKSINGGKDWKASFATFQGYGGELRGLHFLNKDIGYVANRFGMILKTNNGGEDWIILQKPDTMSSNRAINDVYMLDENTGFFVGQISSSKSLIYKTTNGGETFTEIQSTFSKTINSVDFLNYNDGVIVGDNFNVAYTNDGGLNWTKSMIPETLSNNLKEVKFFDDNLVIAVGGNYSGGCLFKSYDKGKTWEKSNLPTESGEIFGFDGHKADTIWITTHSTQNKCKIFYSLDTCKTWILHSNITSFLPDDQLYSVTVDPFGRPWVTSLYSRIYYYQPYVSDVKDQFNEISYSLNQNYPNPFNPSTTISFDLNKNSNVSLIVYDVLGKEVASLVNGNLSSGEHKYDFNGVNLTSGAYFYKLSIEGKSEVKKMMLLK